jgi:O-acetyl-ADP-ribose deacetylase (regulator of RNase III)
MSCEQPVSQRIFLIKGDITRMEVDAIVNAANSTLMGGGGVDGAIHRAAGMELQVACAALGGCPPGEARITPGFKLPARHVIHTVGPVWNGGDRGEAEVLACCYRNCLALAREQGLWSIAFPGISTGIYGFPRDLAAAIAVREVLAFLPTSPNPDKVILVAFDDDGHAALQTALAGSIP